jgi:hypothetical protein
VAASTPNLPQPSRKSSPFQASSEGASRNTKVKRLAPSFGGAVRFIPEKYQQRITKFLYFADI